MIDKLKYGYKMSMPLLDKYLCSQAMAAAPDLFPGDSDKSREEKLPVRLSDSYSTNGWDTVSVCSVADLNTAIRAQGTYPREMDYTMTDSGIEYQLEGDFEPWFIVTGGDGANVNLQISFTKATVRLGTAEYKTEQCTAVIQVHLNYFPEPEKIAVKGEYELGICKEKQVTLAISVIAFSSDLPHLAVEPIANAIFAEWLNSGDTLNRINILFATAQLSTFEAEEFAWLVPTYSSYAYTDVDNDPAKSKFAVLCMLKERIPPQVHQVPPIQFEEGCNYAFLLNREIFVMYQLLPSLPLAFDKATSDDFELNMEDKISITAKNIALSPVKYGALNYYPKLSQMTITVDEYAISCEVDFQTEISPGIVAKTFVRTVNGVQLGQNVDGEPIMEYVEVAEPVTRNETEVEPWVVVTEVIAELIVAVVGLCVGKVVTTVVRRVVIAVVVAVTCAVISVVIHVIIEKVISEGVQDILPSIVPMTSAATKYVRWPFLGKTNEVDFEVKDIRLNGTLSFQGGIA